jgi:ABC-type multidrug transport system fused ATPase/permease subunit
LPGSNAVDAAAGVRKLMAQMKQRFPADMEFVVSLDTTLSVTQGIKEIVKTLAIALVLVILVVYLFLQSWRATLIPLLAVPVSLIGTFAVFPLFGFSINTLSLFGLVLAIGLGPVPQCVGDRILHTICCRRTMDLGLHIAVHARKKSFLRHTVRLSWFIPSWFIPSNRAVMPYPFVATHSLPGFPRPVV